MLLEKYSVFAVENALQKTVSNHTLYLSEIRISLFKRIRTVFKENLIALMY